MTFSNLISPERNIDELLAAFKSFEARIGESEGNVFRAYRVMQMCPLFSYKKLLSTSCEKVVRLMQSKTYVLLTTMGNMGVTFIPVIVK